MRPVRALPLRWALRAFALAIPTLLVGLLAYGVLTQGPDTRIDDSLANARAVRAPAFRLAVLTPGKLGDRLAARLSAPLRAGQVSVADLAGIPVVLNFWASWCVPCREEAPLLERAWRQQGRPQGVLFVGLDMQDLTGDARDFLNHFHVDYLNIRDPSNPVARSYGVTGVPETFFISATGMIVGHVIGVVSPSELREGIVAARTGQVVGSARGGDRRSIR
jgi:cytochrome c biogenesis protein CcmG/thiol:disulfide interchange protein DsbE